MTATYRPIRCPHGTDMEPARGRHEVVTVYTDGCRASGGIPARFWCGSGEMSKPNGVSITEGEYLRDWDLAIEVNEDERRRQWYIQRGETNAAHAEALILNEGDELYDTAVLMCTFQGLISKRPCTLPLDHDGVHSVWGTHPGYDVTWGQDPIKETARPNENQLSLRQDYIESHSEFLGEVPWSDRADD